MEMLSREGLVVFEGVILTWNISSGVILMVLECGSRVEISRIMGELLVGWE